MAGKWAPQGRYVAELTAVGAYGTIVLRRTVYAGGFTATPSTSAPRPGATLTVVFRSVEPLAGAPTARVAQAGRAAVPMTVVRLADGSWRARVTVAAGAPGRATVSLLGRDTAGNKNRASLVVTSRRRGPGPLHSDHDRADQDDRAGRAITPPRPPAPGPG